MGTNRQQLPALAMRAEVAASSIDVEARTFDLTWTTGASVLRRSWIEGDYREELSLEPEHVRMERLQNGAPLLNTHQDRDLDAVLGVVESASLEGDHGVAKIRFPAEGIDLDADRIFRKVADKIIRKASVGYRVYRYEKTEEEGKLPVFRATDWEPYELSLTPMGADDGAGVRSGDQQTNPCEFVLDQEIRNMPSKKPAATTEITAPSTGITEDAVAKREAAAKKAERERCLAIRHLGDSLELPAEFVERAIADELELDDVRAQAIDMHAEARRAAAPVEQIDGRIELGENRARTGMVEGVRSALMHRADPGRNELTDAGRQYAGRTLLAMARRALEAIGIKTDGMSKRVLAGTALGLEQRAGLHSTSDFPLILADVAGKTLRRAYDEAPQTFSAWARRTTLPDFKQAKRTQLGEAPTMPVVLEGDEYTYGTIGEGREVYNLITYGRKFALTRQTLINDDLDAFTRLPMMFGRAARDLESNLVYDHFLSDPTMGDAKALFHADHNNSGAGVISVAAIGTGRTAMRKQTGLDGGQKLNVAPAMMIVPAALETIADQFLSTALLADAAGNVNPFAGRLQSIAEPRLDDVSALEWYLAADPAQIDTLEYAYLEGEDGVAIESRVGFDVDGVEVKARLDFGVKVIDWRGFYKSSGA